jgi:hypothetical protein
MSYDTLISRLILVKKSAPRQKNIAQSHRANCPCCAGSLCLSLAETADTGATLLHCFKGCSAAEIVAALGLQTHDLFPRSAPVGQALPGFKNAYEWSNAAISAQVVQDAAWAILTKQGDEIEAFERLLDAIKAFKKSARQAFVGAKK